MTPTVAPAMRSACRYSLHLYDLIQREQGSKTDSHSSALMPLSLVEILSRRGGAGGLAAFVGEGCWSGITRTDRMAERDAISPVLDEA